MNFDSRFNRMHSFVSVLIKIVAVIILVFWVLMGYAAYNIYQNTDFSHGLQGIVNQVWYGTNKS